MRNRALSTFLVVAVLIAGSAIAQIDDSDEAGSLYARGQRQIREGDWFGAAKTFEQLAGRWPESPDLDLFIFQRARANYHLGDLSAARAGFEFYLQRFEDTPEAPYARFFLGNIAYRQNDLQQAVLDWIEAYRISRDGRLDQMVRSSIRYAAINAPALILPVDEMVALPPGKRCPLLRAAAEARMATGDIDLGNAILTPCGERLREGDVSDLPRRPVTTDVEIAMVLPFSGEMQPWAEEIYNGAVIATELNRGAVADPKLSRHDSRAEPVDAARAVKSIASRGHATVAVGPLTSEAAAVCSGVLSCADLPLIIPAATQAGLTELASTAFQLSPNIGLQGIRMAEYAVDSLTARDAVIMTPTGPDHLLMARAFADRFEELGGRIEAIQYYRPRDNDFGGQLRDLKAEILDLDPDSVFYITPDGDTLDPDGVPVEFDVIYLPGEARQLRLLLPQIRFYNVNGAYLGSDGWGDEVIYELGDNVTRGAVFPSPFLGVGTSEEYFRFAVAYDTRYAGQPPRLAALGYDAVSLALRAAARSRTREGLAEELRQLVDYQGASGRITFGPHRENIEMPLYRIWNGRADLISGAPSPEVVPDTDTTGDDNPVADDEE